MTREQARALYSEYLEDALEPARRDELQAFLAGEPECAADLFALERTMTLLHRLPPREPSLDLWREFAPRVEAFRAERRLSFAERLRLHWGILVAQVSEGVILWTHALAHHAHLRLHRHLVHDSRPAYRSENGRD